MIGQEKTSLALPNIFLFDDNETQTCPTPNIYESSHNITIAGNVIFAIINAGAYVAGCVEEVTEMFLTPEPEEGVDHVIVRPI
jgi:hypothetical protein